MTGEARSVVVRLSADASQFIAGMQAAGKAGQDAMAKMQGFTNRQSQALDQLGTTAGKFGLAAAAGLGMAGKAATDWESQFAGVEKTVDGTRSQITGLEGDLREMARTMPATHQEIAATAEAAGQLGVATEDIDEFTETMLKLGETTDLTADGAATSIAQFMNVMGTAADEVDEIGNTLVDLGNKGASTESQILALAQRLSGVGALTGASEQDVLALSSALANLGVQAELGGGAVQRVFLEINDAVSKGGAGLDGFAEISGMSAREFATAWGNDPVRAFDALLQGLGGVQATGGNVAAVLDDLGIKGTQNLSVMLRLAGAGDTLTTALDQSADAWDENNALTEEFAKRLGTTSAEVQIAWNNIRDAGIDAGAALLPLLSAASEKVSDLTGAFQALPDPVQKSMTGLAGVAAVVGGAGWITAKTINGVNDLRGALGDLGLTADGTKGSLKGVAASAGLLAGLTVIGTGVMSQTDALLRSREAADATAESYAELYAALAQSNVGKYASDLGIDVQRLAEDLVTSGESGEYATAVFEQLAEGAYGSSAAIKDIATSFLPGYTSGAEKASSAVEDLRSIVDNSTDSLGKGAAAADDAAGANDRLAGASENSAGALEDQVDATNEAIDAMRRLRESTLAAFDAETRWGAAVSEARAAAEEGARGLSAMTEAGRENRSALSELASSWNELPGKVQNADGRFQAARRTFIEVATAMTGSRDRARELAREMLELPRDVVVEAEMDTGDFDRSHDRTMRRLLEVDEHRSVAHIDADDRPAMRSLSEVIAESQEWDGSTWMAYIDADPSGAAAAAREAQRHIDGVYGKTVFIDVQTRYGPGIRTGAGGTHLERAAGGTVAGPRRDFLPAHLTTEPAA